MDRLPRVCVDGTPILSAEEWHAANRAEALEQLHEDVVELSQEYAERDDVRVEDADHFVIDLFVPRESPTEVEIEAQAAEYEAAKYGDAPRRVLSVSRRIIRCETCHQPLMFHGARCDSDGVRPYEKD